MIRRAEEKDIPKIEDLLRQVDMVHHNSRPDIFRVGQKYSAQELEKMLCDENKPILVCVDDSDCVMGYCFCMMIRHVDDPVLTDVKTLYIDDLCVDEKLRGRRIGKELYSAAVSLAREMGCYNLTLNVWSCNPSAMRFYESCGLKPQKIAMETIL